jgi:uncharacterized protein YbbC (DUF1343 family)
MTCIAFCIAIACSLAMADAPLAKSRNSQVVTGAEVLAASGFSALAGKRVGLIANQTTLVGGEHLADVLSRAPNVKLAAILAPEHGFRGAAEAGAKVGDTTDAKAGVPVYSLYGATRKPAPHMLRGLDVLVFDMQDIGTRYYTYISTMGLAMQAAAAAGLPFVVLDRPNPLGGEYVSGFVLEPAHTSFVGQYPIPVVHGLTVGELARMIQGERWMDGLDKLQLTVVPMQGWKRAMRWPQTGLAWVPTSPNIPTFESALAYPGMGFVGETAVNEGRGTPTPFTLLGAPWLDGPRIAERLNALALPGARFEPAVYTPRSIPSVATNPRWQGRAIQGARIIVTDVARSQPLEAGMHVLAALAAEARSKGAGPLIPADGLFNHLAGTLRLRRMLESGSDGTAIGASWQAEVAAFRSRRAPYLLY